MKRLVLLLLSSLAVPAFAQSLAAAQERLARQREIAEYGRQSVEATQRRLDAGEISRNDASRFRLDVARASNDMRQTEADLHRTRVDLARLLAAERIERGATGTLDLLDERRQSKTAELDELQVRAGEAKDSERYQAAIETYREPAVAR